MNVVESIPPLSDTFSLLNLLDDEFQTAVLGISLALIRVRTLPKTLLSGCGHDLASTRPSVAVELLFPFAQSRNELHRRSNCASRCQAFEVGGRRGSHPSSIVQ